MPPLLVKWMAPEVLGFRHCKERLQFALTDAARALRGFLARVRFATPPGQIPNDGCISMEAPFGDVVGGSRNNVATAATLRCARFLA